MEKLHGKYFVVAAVFAMVVTFTSAADLGLDCSGPGAGNCTTPNATCDTTCVCKGSFKANADNTTCIKRALGDRCTANTNSDCDGVEHAVCKPTDNVCACVGQYKPDGAACVEKGYGDSCTANTDCAGDANSECTTANSKTCVCKANFTEINNVCEIGLGNPCTNDTSCNAVNNAECPPATKECTCKANFKEDNGQCSTAYGLQTLMSAPLALLVSLLTIFFTRLH